MPAAAAASRRRHSANDMISFWIYISVFIDDVRLFGTGKQTDSSSRAGFFRLAVGRRRRLR